MIRTRKRRRDKEAALAWWQAVMNSNDFRCVVTGRRAHEAHHVVRQQTLRRHGREDALWDVRNGIPIHDLVHDNHHSAYRRIPRRCVPQSAWEFARELGEWAVLEIERHYPKAE